MKRPVGLQIRSAPGEVASKIMAHFGKRLREWMEQRGVGLVDIAQALQISYTYVAFLGKDKPYGRLLSPENAVALAEFLRIDPDAIFAAMGQINPFLAEEVPAEVLEEELIQLHKNLRDRLKEIELEKREAKRK